MTPALPYLLFLMLFFTFLKVSPRDLKLLPWHGIGLALQLLLAAGSYFLLSFSPVLAQAVMLCFLMPSATAAPIIAAKLGGSIPNLTTYTVLTNLSTALIAPLAFAYVNPDGIAFWQATWSILQRVSLVLLAPLFTAWLIRFLASRVHNRQSPIANRQSPIEIPFYLWMLTILILMGNITYTLVHDTYAVRTAVYISVGAVISCFLQFFIGHRLSADRVSAGQALGQKNTTLAIWMAQSFLNPLTALAPAVYMIVQNIYNALQLRFHHTDKA